MHRILNPAGSLRGIVKAIMVGVKEVMTQDVVSVGPETPLADAARVVLEHDFDGVPVVDSGNKLVGILTQYDMISKGSALHLPTVQFLLKNLPIYKEDKERFRTEVKEITDITVKDLMNSDPLFFTDNTTYEQAVNTFKDHHRVNPVPVVDKEHRVIGVVSRYDILKILSALH